MVRKNPLVERGPTPPGGRGVTPTAPAVPKTLFELRPLDEYKRTWGVSIAAVKKHIEFLQLYASLGVPDLPLEDLIELRDSIDQIIPKRLDQDE